MAAILKKRALEGSEFACFSFFSPLFFRWIFSFVRVCSLASDDGFFLFQKLLLSRCTLFRSRPRDSPELIPPTRVYKSLCLADLALNQIERKHASRPSDPRQAATAADVAILLRRRSLSPPVLLLPFSPGFCPRLLEGKHKRVVISSLSGASSWERGPKSGCFC